MAKLPSKLAEVLNINSVGNSYGCMVQTKGQPAIASLTSVVTPHHFVLR